MPRKDFDLDKYLAEITAGLPEETSSAVRSTLSGNQVIVDRLADSVLRNSDYGRLTAEAKKREEAADAFYQTLVQTDAENRKKFAELNDKVGSATAQLEKYRTEFGDLGGAPAIDTSKFVTKDELASEAARVQSGWVDFSADLAQLGIEHYKEFGEVLDTKGLLAETAKQKRDLKSVHDDLVFAQRSARQEEALKAKIKEAYDKGRVEALSSVQLPPSPLISDAHPLTLREQMPNYKPGQMYKEMMSDYLAGKYQAEAALPNRA